MGSRKNEGIKGEKDRKFLSKLQTSTMQELRCILADHAKAPAWKIVAITRAMNRLLRESDGN